jgi:hypothetical protein
MKRIISCMPMAAAIAVLASCGSNPTSTAMPYSQVSVTTLALTSALGLTDSGMPRSYASVISFERTTHAHVNVAMYYSGWYEGFDMAFGRDAQSQGATVLVNIDSTGVALNAITAGRYDAFLKRFGREIRSFGHPVIVAFDHEMNGTWFDYGYGHTTPTDFVAAWRHVHQVVDSVTNLVSWLWTVNIPAANRTEPIAPLYPGSQYVDLIGIDGYDWSGSLSFNDIFGTTIREVKAIDPSKRILIAETSVVHGPNAAKQVTALFLGVRKDHLLGFVWFNIDKKHASATTDHHDWRLQDDPAALAAFRKAVATFGI